MNSFSPSPYSEGGAQPYGFWDVLVKTAIEAGTSLVAPAIGQKSRSAQAQTALMTEAAKTSAESMRLQAQKEKTKVVLYVGLSVVAVTALGLLAFSSSRSS